MIIDGVATNRIMLKVLLSSAWYHVVQADALAGLSAILRRVKPDLIVTAVNLPDGRAQMLRSDPRLADVPIIAITAQNDHGARMAALAAGIDDVLCHPLDDTLLQARIRSLIRARTADQELRASGAAPDGFGLAEAPAAALLPPARVVLATEVTATATLWKSKLSARLERHRLVPCALAGAHGCAAATPPDALILEMTADTRDMALDLLSNLRASAVTRHAAVIAVANSPKLAAEALDRGADDVMPHGYHGDELALRLTNQLRNKARADRARDTLREGLRAAHRDPLTGLFNRRHAIPFLARTIRASVARGSGFAVMLADLDLFKQVNDRYGHLAGDAVLAEAAKRLSATVGPRDLVARFGGEEFLIVLTDSDPDRTEAIAGRMRHAIEAAPFPTDRPNQMIRITTSIGVAVVSPDRAAPPEPEALIARADAALYRAKEAGRNTVSLFQPAA
ncbi:two-component system, cell cycle response regulator [Jhaorihella thermophila]|uniref:diguanylate cyclase n=1 Tax=Jhaorihella thermophila TaxID=488547 RepID=A0A1H5S5Z5_9RHOB|nr:two-component system, cell cycle response regulator [Jhaorihella thermophila]